MVLSRILAQLFALAVVLLIAIHFFRYEIATGPGTTVFRLDRSTGQINLCRPTTSPAYSCDE